MKRILVIGILLLSLSAGYLIAETSPIQKFQKDPTTENLLEGIASYTKEMKDDPDNTVPQIMLNWLLLTAYNNNLDKLDAKFDELAVGMKFQFANQQLAIGEFDTAIKTYDKINMSSPKWSCPWRHKGEAYYKSGQMEAAEKAFLKAIETRETHYDAYVWLAKAQMKMKKYKTALESLEKGLTYKGKDIEEPEEEVSSIEEYTLHYQLLKKNNKPEAEKIAAKLQKIDPDGDWKNFE
ncbi:MAG: hypothetical protein K8S56_08135 [Candidatus Cloacimonetes bacterium]|nr:hypothetical protein [Candidatus Cloacimonadota bacterium]